MFVGAGSKIGLIGRIGVAGEGRVGQVRRFRRPLRSMAGLLSHVLGACLSSYSS